MTGPRGTLNRVAMAAATAAAAVLTCTREAAAQNEAALKPYFEGRRVTVRIAMPGTSDGVNVHADSRRPIDVEDYRDSLKRYGVAIHAGESTIVTLVKVKRDLIEFQLDGGGYGTFGDDTSTSVYIPHIQKSERENELEKRVKDEPDRDRRRALQRELDQVRGRRERENRRIDMERQWAEALKKEFVAQKRLEGGSRFNIRYEGRVPPDVDAEDVMAALAEYVDFDGAELRVNSGSAPTLKEPVGDITMLRKGMTRAEAERTFGRPIESSQRTVAEFAISTLVFDVGDQRVTANFVEDVLVRYTIASQ